MCRKKQVSLTFRTSPLTRETEGFKPLETIPSVLSWLAGLNKKQGTQRIHEDEPWVPSDEAVRRRPNELLGHSVSRKPLDGPIQRESTLRQKKRLHPA